MSEILAKDKWYKTERTKFRFSEGFQLFRKLSISFEVFKDILWIGINIEYRRI